MTRQEKIDRMVNNVESWNVQALIDSIQIQLENRFNALTDAELDDEYDMWFGGEEDKTITPTNQCSCSMNDLMARGCKCGGY